jgi:hypothetical protein
MSEHSGASALRATTPSRNSDSDIVDARSASDNIAAASYALSLKSILPHRIIALSKRVDAALAKLYAPYDLDISELMVLAVVAVSARATAKDVSRRTAMHKTKISRAVKQLNSARPDHTSRRPGRSPPSTSESDACRSRCI